MKIRLYDRYWTIRLRYGAQILSLFFAYIGIFYFITFSEEPVRWVLAILIAVSLFWILWKAKERNSKYRMVYLEDGSISVGELGKAKTYRIDEIEDITCDPKRLYQDATILMKDGAKVTFIPRSLDPWSFELKEPEIIKKLKNNLNSNKQMESNAYGLRPSSCLI